MWQLYTLLEGEGIKCYLVGALVGFGTKHRLNASHSTHLFEALSLFYPQPHHPKTESLEWGYLWLLPACALCDVFLGENKSSVSHSPETPGCQGSCWVNTLV